MTDKMSDGVGIREFARQVGKSPNWISTLAREGRLPRNEDGLIPLEEGMQAMKLMQKARMAKKTKAQIQKLLEDDTLDSDDDDSPMTKKDFSSSAEILKAFNKARAEEKIAQAKLRELELRLKEGLVVEKAEVDADAKALGTLMSEFGRSMPSRYAGLLENRSARECESVLKDMWSDFLKVLHKSKFAKGE